MKSKLTEEIDEIKYLISFNRNKILSEQNSDTSPTGSTTGNTISTPPSTGNTEPTSPVPQTPNPTVMSATSIEQGRAGDPYQYKFEDDGNVQKYFYGKKGQENWKQGTKPESVDGIKRNVFKIN